MFDSMYIEIDEDGLAWWYDDENDVEWFFCLEDNAWYIMGDDGVVYWEDEETGAWYFYDEDEDDWFECEVEEEDEEFEIVCPHCFLSYIGDEI